jgi:hypothetical protein
MRESGSGKASVRFREERGRRGGGRPWWHADARARGGGGSLLEEGEGEGMGVGWAGWEPEAQEKWGWLGRPSGLGRKGGPGRFGSSAKTKKINPFRILN